MEPVEPVSETPARTGRPDLVLLIAVWEFLTAFGTLVAIGALVVFVFPRAVYFDRIGVGTLTGLVILTAVLAGYGALAVAAGVGLLLGREWGRIMGLVHAAIGLINIPVGTVVGILVLIYLTKREVRDYFLKQGV